MLRRRHSRVGEQHHPRCGAQHVDGAADPQRINPDNWTLDQHWLDQTGRAQIMLDLLFGYQSNVALYPTWQRWLRERQPPLLLPWGRNDAFFPEASARAYLADAPGAELHLLNGGHFILDEYVDTVADLIRDFVARHAAAEQSNNAVSSPQHGESEESATF